MILPENAPFRIGDWRIDPALDEISCDGRTIKLEPRTMCVLVCLARRAGEVVSVEDLLDAVWKDVVVTQHSVYQAVAVLRRSFGDDPKAPTYIDNVPRRGYRLLAPVAVPATSPPAEAVAEPALAEPSTTVVIPANAQSGTVGIIRAPVPASWSLKKGVLVAVALVILGTAAAYLAIGKLRISKSAVSSPTVAASPTPTAFSPPAHSIAVLPFANMSGDKEQEYFSEGLSAEVLNSLADINGLQVAGRTSSFHFKGKDVDLGTIAHKLNVAAVLEGSVQRSASTIRVTAQLTNAVTGFQVWSKTYDRPLGDVLKLQTDIATAVASALKVTLLGDEAAKIELGGTHNPAAFDAYLRGSKAYSSEQGASDYQRAIAAYTEAIRLDPNYALAFAGRSIAFSGYAMEFATGPAIRESFVRAQADAQQATNLAPELGEAHLALGRLLNVDSHDFTRASEEYGRAMALAPGNAVLVGESGRFAVYMGRFEAGLAAAHRAVALDPLSSLGRGRLGQALYFARRYQEAVATFAEVISLDSDYKQAYGDRGLAYYALGDFQSARSSCESKSDHWTSQWCLAVTYDKLGRHADAEAALAKLEATFGDAAAYQYAAIYAQWGNTAKALEWLETAVKVRDPGLVTLKTESLMDPLRKEARFQAIERKFKFQE